jgi:hypothetical protein
MELRPPDAFKFERHLPLPYSGQIGRKCLRYSFFDEWWQDLGASRAGRVR